jgi:hypothetical protein
MTHTRPHLVLGMFAGFYSFVWLLHTELLASSLFESIVQSMQVNLWAVSVSSPVTSVFGRVIPQKLQLLRSCQDLPCRVTSALIGFCCKPVSQRAI